MRIAFPRRRCALALSVLLLPACASVPGVVQLCDRPSAAAVAVESSPAKELQGEGCEPTIVASQFQTVGGVQQRGSQTRTLGVPRGFLVAMIVLIVIFALA